MAHAPIATLDLNFQGKTHAIASYLIRHKDGAILIESGPGSTLSSLEAALAKENLTPRDVTHVFVTHIHLDHAGASGWLSRQGAEIYVHPLGAPHFLNPEKLIASATRIYGDKMDSLWGDFLPVSEDKLKVTRDAEEVVIGDVRVLVLSVPGHAEHHNVYFVDGVCFTGDVGGVRIPGYQYMRLPMPPPELHFGKWRESLARIRSHQPKRVAPTHFGIFDDAEWHLQEVERNIDATERWLEKVMPSDPPIEKLRQDFSDWIVAEGEMMNLSADTVRAYGLANPLGMSADGLQRYWKKIRLAIS